MGRRGVGARRRRFTSAAVAGALAASCSLIAAGAPVGASAGQEPGSWAVPEDRGQQVPGLAGSLQDDAREGAPVHPAGLPEHATDAPPDQVTVVLETTDVHAAGAAVSGAGGTVRTTAPGLVKADVPASSLAALVSARGVTFVREPYRPVPQAMSEGVGYSRVEPWHEAGWIGTGTKVAVVDGGFAGYAAKVGGELPAGTTTDFSRCNGLPGSSDHGTAVAEIVHDMAPGAELLLVCIEDDVDFVNRMATMEAMGVDVVNGSFGFALTGRGDGSGGPGTVARAVADLRAQGVLYVAAAGNYGQHHFHTAAVGDAPLPGNGDFVDISPGDDALSFYMPAGGVAAIAVSWDAWPTTRQDFDIYVGNDACGLLGASTADQAGGPLPPVEYLIFESCTTGPATYELFVDRYSGTATPRLDIWFDGDIGWVEHTTRSSVVEPASSPAVMAVGAHCVTHAARQSYSSQGPTIDGRTKPDISGPDATSGSVYGPSSHCSSGFTGTSASAPHVTGGAALVLGANPDLEVAELQQLLEDKARDAGTPPGEDNDYGAGILDLGDPGSAAVSAAQPFTPHGPVRLLDSRPTATGASEGHPGLGAVGTPIGPRGMLRIPVVGVAGVPADATAAVLNVTAVSPTAGGYLTVYPDGPRPLASNINFAAKQVVAVAVTATIADDGWITIFNSAGSTHVVVDLTGWYGATGTGGPATDGFEALPAPKRALNTQPTQTGYAEGAFGPKGATTRPQRQQHRHPGRRARRGARRRTGGRRQPGDGAGAVRWAPDHLPGRHPAPPGVGAQLRPGPDHRQPGHRAGRVGGQDPGAQPGDHRRGGRRRRRVPTWRGRRLRGPRPARPTAQHPDRHESARRPRPQRHVPVAHRSLRGGAHRRARRVVRRRRRAPHRRRVPHRLPGHRDPPVRVEHQLHARHRHRQRRRVRRGDRRHRRLHEQRRLQPPGGGPRRLLHRPGAPTGAARRAAGSSPCPSPGRRGDRVAADAGASRPCSLPPTTRPSPTGRPVRARRESGRTRAGSPEGARTCVFWSGRRDSNPRPQPWQGCALPAEPRPRGASDDSRRLRSGPTSERSWWRPPSRTA